MHLHIYDMKVIFLKQIVRIAFVTVSILSAIYMWLSLPKAHREAVENPSVQDEEQPLDTPAPPIAENNEHMVHIERAEGVIEVPLETYLQGVVGSEMPASFEVEALKAQAIAARTFVCKREYQVDDSTASQVYHSDEEMKKIWGNQYETYHQKVKDAIDDTKGIVMTYQGECITAAFFSSSNGMTNNVEDYWTSALPYLRSVESFWDIEEANNEQQVFFDADTFAAKLGFQNHVSNISTPTRYENGYVESLTIDGIVFSGREIREKLQLRSSAFEIQVETDGYTFITHGYGHGIGMSQYGAQAMALDGKTYKDILTHYYTDIEFQTL